MSLSILSKEIIQPDELFKNISLAALKSKLFYTFDDNALKDNGKIENLNMRRYYGNGEDDYVFLLMDIYDQDRVINFMSKIKVNNEIYYCLCGTDNTPEFCYDFSLAYLRLCPNQLISIHDWFFSLIEIELLEQKGGWYDGWYLDFRKIDVIQAT